MINWCAYCQKFQGELPPFDNYAVTHGMCLDCKARGLEVLEEDFDRILSLRAIQEHLFDAGTRQDLAAAGHAIEQARQAGIASVDILAGLVSPLLWETGHLWAAGKISVADEHRVTAFCSTIIREVEEATASMAAPDSSAEVDILLSNGPGNSHSLGIRILNLWLRSKGVCAVIAGERCSLESTLSSIEKFKPRYVGFSVAMSEQCAEMLELCEQLRSRLPNCPPLLIGGNVVKLTNECSHSGITCIFDLADVLTLVKRSG